MKLCCPCSSANVDPVDRAVSLNSPTHILKYWWGFTGSNLAPGSSSWIYIGFGFIYLFILSCGVESVGSFYTHETNTRFWKRSYLSFFSSNMHICILSACSRCVRTFRLPNYAVSLCSLSEWVVRPLRQKVLVDVMRTCTSANKNCFGKWFFHSLSIHHTLYIRCYFFCLSWGCVFSWGLVLCRSSPLGDKASEEGFSLSRHQHEEVCQCYAVSVRFNAAAETDKQQGGGSATETQPVLPATERRQGHVSSSCSSMLFISKYWCLKFLSGPGSYLNTKYFDRDEDMQSLASLMSVKHSDIGNLDDFDDGDDEAVEDRRSAGLGSGPAALLTGEAKEMLGGTLGNS